MSSYDRAVDRLAAALTPSVPGGAAQRDAGQENPTTPGRLVRGHIVSHAGSAAVVTTDGTNNRSDVPWVASYSIADGDDVWLIEQPPYLLIIGKSA